MRAHSSAGAQTKQATAFTRRARGDAGLICGLIHWARMPAQYASGDTVPSGGSIEPLEQFINVLLT